jgi:hypothetical protein
MGCQFAGAAAAATTKSCPQSMQRTYDAGGDAELAITMLRSALHLGHLRLGGAMNLARTTSDELQD